MSNMPKYLLRNCALWADRICQVGQCAEIGLPELKRKKTKVENAGMVMPINVPMNYEEQTADFKFTSLDPAMLLLYGVNISKLKSLLVTGDLFDADGTESSASASMTGWCSEVKFDKWKAGGDKLAENEFKWEIWSYKLIVAGQEIYRFDPFNVYVGGVEETAGTRRNLLLG
jgi:P2 family phage contractile tail tube protein